MRKIDFDYHVHTTLSSCGTESATVENYLELAKTYGLREIGFADHVWDQAVGAPPEWYAPQDVRHVLSLREKLKDIKTDVKLYVGCEAEYDYARGGVSLTEESAEQFDFVIVPNSHTHLVMPKAFYEPHQRHADFMLEAYKNIIKSPVSRYITAMAHPFAAVCCPYNRNELYGLITDDQYKEIFDETAQKGIAVEINMSCFYKLADDEIASAPEMRMFRLAKERGCRFSFGSDAHANTKHDKYRRTNLIADLLELKDEDVISLSGR